ncbi:DNA mismatch repair protein MutL [Neochlamydia sp. TUME1]|nr:DNA mismatch repair protein MutL [Neochlamydia sp. TUME1]
MLSIKLTIIYFSFSKTLEKCFYLLISFSLLAYGSSFILEKFKRVINIMPSKIRVLDEHTINKIAAGEVIESPASVVKELMENSLDAGATEICVEIKGGGRQLIRVTDNGAGMQQDDAVLCLERHATSKIKEVEDIQSIFSMGFRGEAIPSIASISKFTLLTAPQEGGEGTLVIVEGGKLMHCGPAARAPGTTIEVKSLFFNVPVRRKFQKSPAYEAQEIHKIITLLALGYPHVKFQLINNQSHEIQTGGSSGKAFSHQLKERIAALMGAEFVTSCCEVEITNGDYSLHGYVGAPHYSRQNRTGQYLFINKRAVFSPLISAVVRDAYGTSLPTNRHPIFVLHLNVPGETVDVNVHPQKKEVRLRQENILRELVLKGIQQAIHKGNVSSYQDHQPIHEDFSSPASTSTFIMPAVKPAFSLHPIQERNLAREYQPLPPMAKAPSREEPQPSFLAPLAQEKRSFPRVLATIPGYIILDAYSLEAWKQVSPDTLCLVDQKAAHARVIFENLLQARTGNAAVQSLLIPHHINLPPSEAAALSTNLDNFAQIGVHIHESGPHSFMIDAVPATFGNIDLSKWVVDLLDMMHSFPEGKMMDKEMEKRLSVAASHAAVHYRKRLQTEEAQSIVNQLFATSMPFFCPQGKSTLAFISAEEIFRNFKG